ncbi:MAG: hypothetical protein ACREDK_02230 [Thermoplasmata archaeon]
MSFVVLGLLAGISVLMAYFTATLVKWASEATSRVHAATILFLLAMMAEMLAGGLLYYLHPSESGAVAGLWLAGGAMSFTVFPLFFVLASEVRRQATEGPAFAPAPVPAHAGFVTGIVGLVLANELLMGIVFSAAAGGALPGSDGGALGTGLLVAAVNSPWFLLTMAAEMFATTVFLRDRLPRPVVLVLLAQSLIMAFSPPAFTSAGWAEVAILVSSGVMIGLFVYVLEHLYRQPRLSPAFSRYLVLLLAVYALMMAGLFAWQYAAVGGVFALAVVLEMVVFLDAVVRPHRFAEGLTKPWLERPVWAFGLLFFIFVAEVFMGAVLDVQLQPDVFRGGFFALPLAGPPATALVDAVSNGFWFIANVTNSTWFLAMMGLEMGALVAFKLRETRQAENRVRLLLMMGSYAAFVVFYPSVYFSLAYPQAPDPSQVAVLGWSMGLGSYPVAPVVFGAILLTYAVTGSLAVLFGRRVVCSVFCAAPLMYQGTTLDAMKSFNRSSTVGRKYLSSRLRSLYGVTTGVTMGSLVVVSTASYLDATGRWAVTILGADPSVFFFAFSFSVLWYLMFVLIPFTGNYNCVTMGWCYTGTIVQAFQKIGFFKLKVRDRQICRDCTTLDCAKACPIGLVDMPGHFRTKGEFRSSKCCGVGDCVEACPWDNLYVADVRHWLRRRLGRPETRERGVRPRPSARPVGPPPRAAARPLTDGAIRLPMAPSPAATPRP